MAFDVLDLGDLIEVELALSREMLKANPIMQTSHGNLLRDDVFEMMDRFLDKDYYTASFSKESF